MKTARQAEAVGAQELGSALGVTPGILSGGQRPECATGSAYRTVPTDDLDNVALVINKTPGPVTISHDVASHLARRSGPSDAR